MGKTIRRNDPNKKNKEDRRGKRCVGNCKPRCGWCDFSRDLGDILGL